LTALDKSLVYGQPGVVNRDYQGDILEAGNSVKVASIGDVSIGDYTKDADIDDPEILTDADQTLVIDQQKYFNFYIDSVDRAQQNVNVLDEAMRRAAYKLNDTADSYIATLMDAAITSGNTLGSLAAPRTPTKSDAYEHLVDLGTLLDEGNTPIAGRFCIVPAWFHGLLLKDDRFVRTGTALGDHRLMNGEVGEAAGFMIFKSNNVPNTAGSKYKIIAGHSIATSYAEQIVDVQAFKPEKRFGDAVKGLHVYGAKVLRPQNLAVLIADRS
jgi:hypothetical protein